MIALLSFLWSGCWHKWETLRTIATRHSCDGEYSYTSRDFILRCERCGNVKRRNLQP